MNIKIWVLVAVGIAVLLVGYFIGKNSTKSNVAASLGAMAPSPQSGLPVTAVAKDATTTSGMANPSGKPAQAIV